VSATLSSANARCCSPITYRIECAIHGLLLLRPPPTAHRGYFGRSAPRNWLMRTSSFPRSYGGGVDLRPAALANIFPGGGPCGGHGFSSRTRERTTMTGCARRSATPLQATLSRDAHLLSLLCAHRMQMKNIVGDSLILPLVLQVVDTPLWLLMLQCLPFVAFECCWMWECVAFLFWSLFGSHGRLIVVGVVDLHLLSFPSP
jgi:hypothetical protein